MTGTSNWVWIAFNVFVISLLAADLFVFHRRPRAMRVKEAAAWSCGWISLALIFNIFLYLFWDRFFSGGSSIHNTEYSAGQAGLLFLTGYLIELSLSVDNLFVIALIFSAFSVPQAYQRRVLFWGILGALVMRGGMIGAGAALIHRFHWIMYVFGGFLLYTGIKMVFHKEEEEFNPEDSKLVKFIRRILPITSTYEKEHFFVRRNGVLMATPLFLVLVLVEFTDLIFAVDSIPAIFAVTSHPFLVYSSNVFAILGLRSLYFVLAGMMGKFTYLKPALSAILIFVGVKMVIAEYFKISATVSLMVVIGILASAVTASLVTEKKVI